MTKKRGDQRGQYKKEKINIRLLYGLIFSLVSAYIILTLFPELLFISIFMRGIPIIIYIILATIISSIFLSRSHIKIIGGGIILFFIYSFITGAPIMPTVGMQWTTYDVPIYIELDTTYKGYKGDGTSGSFIVEVIGDIPQQEISQACANWEIWDDDRDHFGSNVCIPDGGGWNGTSTVAYRNKWIGKIKYFFGDEEHINIGIIGTTVTIPVKKGEHEYNLTPIVQYTQGGELYTEYWNVKVKTLDDQAKFTKHYVKFKF